MVCNGYFKGLRTCLVAVNTGVVLPSAAKYMMWLEEVGVNQLDPFNIIYLIYGRQKNTFPQIPHPYMAILGHFRP